MICPNCGNENPPDYTFCDECGARLQPLTAGVGGGAGAAEMAADGGAGAPQQVAHTGETTSGAVAVGAAPTDGAGGDAGGLGEGTGAGTGAGTAMAPTASANAEEPIPVHHEGPREEEMAAPGGTGDADQPAWEEPYGGGVQVEQQQDQQSVQAPTYPAEEEQAPVPVTEDTVAATGATQEETTYDAGAGRPSMAGGAAQEEHYEPMQVPGTYSDTYAAPAGGGPIVPEDQGVLSQASGAAAAPSTGGGDWAAAALDQLNQAQQALGSGDWGGFGRAMANVRGFLESAAQGGETAGAGAGAGAQAPTAQPPAVTAGPAPATEQAMPAVSEAAPSEAAAPPTPAPEGPPYYSGGAAPAVPAEQTVEPQAEAGTLGVGVPGVMPSGVPQQAAPVMARLVMIATGAELPIPDQEEITVGREDPSSGIFPDIDLTPYGGEEGGVSRRHARLLRIGDEYFVEDLQSTNYTKLDGQRLPAHVRERLEDGARLDFGRVATIFRRS